MIKSESLGNLANAVVRFQGMVQKIKKDSNNPFFKSSYASLSAILEAIQQPLQECNLAVLQYPSGAYGLTTVLIHTSGEYIQEEFEMRPVKDDPQSRGSCITYQRRYALGSVLGLNIDVDDDGNAATHFTQAYEKKPISTGESTKQWLNKNTPQYKQIVERLAEGTATLDQIFAHYAVSKEVRASLEEVIEKQKP